jgi:serine/threonine protein kinase
VSSDRSSDNSIERDPWLGKTISDRYRIDALLGAGGLGMVYRATHLGLDRPVAIKVLLPDLLPSAALRQRFEREVKTLSRLAHPHIVTLTDSGILENGAGYLVMELLGGEALESRLRQGPLQPDQAIAVCRQILLGLAEAHAKHVLHRDIKPGNVFLQPLADGGVHVKLLDFGLAKVRNDLATDPGQYPTLTADGTIVGTPTYMAPEQAAAATADSSSDVYSVGVVLFEMLAGKPPFDGPTKLEVIRAHLGSPVPDLSEIRPALTPTPELRALILKALAKDRLERYASAREMLSALDALPAPAATFSGREEPRPLPPISGTEETLSLRSSELATVDSMPSPPGAQAPPPLPKKATAKQAGPQKKKNELPYRAIFAIGAIVLLVLIGVGVATALWPEDDARSEAAHDPIPRTTAVIDTEDEPDDGEPVAIEDGEDEPIEEIAGGPQNPFNASPLPDELREARRRIFRGRRLTDDQIRDVTRYQRQHPNDSRPALLLARHHRGADWRATVRHYRAAHRIDPNVRGFHPMLTDLIKALGEAPGSGAAVAIEQIYGRDALPEVERALARRRIDAGERRRLERVRGRLEALPVEG